jgi:hypothetical protein
MRRGKFVSVPLSEAGKRNFLIYDAKGAGNAGLV